MKLFVCGPTVYDYMHLGNARTFVVFDAYAKHVRSQGIDLEYIQNITDIDDKIIARAKEQGRDVADYAREWEQVFFEDAKALGITAPEYKRATDHIPEILDQVKRLIATKRVYEIPGDGFYFDLSTFPDYGKLSGRTDLKDDDAVSRIDENENKRNTGDFCVWKRDFETGRPGWHIEDTAITEKYFGPQYDVHGGGMDLMFPHHEAEIAIMESLSGQRPFVKTWMHAGFLVNKSKKMSKSLGNFMTAREALQLYSPEVLRFYLLSAHYRSPLDYSQDSIKQAEAAVARLGEFTKKLHDFEDEMQQQPNEHFDLMVQRAEEAFGEALNEDFNTPKAFGVLFELVKALNTHITTRVLDKGTAERVQEFLATIQKTLGVIPSQTEHIPRMLQMLIDQRERARASKDFTLADKLRAQIEKEGYQIDDTTYGPLVKATTPPSPSYK